MIKENFFKRMSKKAAIKYSVITALVIANIIVFALILMPSVTSIPKDFSINGRLTDSSGSALQGTYNLTFRIYTNLTGTTALWTQANESVTTDSNGVFTARLRNINLNFSDQYYLGIAVASDSEMTPRINLTSSAYAFRAENVTVSGVEFTSNVNIRNNNFTVNSTTFHVDVNNGNVGIGTTAPSSKFEVAKGSGVNEVNLSGVFYVNSTSGNVGIGTTGPNAKLEVNGTAGALRFDVSGTNPTINTTSNNVTITSNGGSVIIRLG